MERTMVLSERALRSRIGVVVSIVGAAVLVLGLLQTTRAAPDGGNTNCPGGTTLVAKFEYSGGSYVSEGGSGGVTISAASATSANWTSTAPIAAVVVKGGTGNVITTYAPAQTSGSFSNAGLPTVGNGNVPDISNVKFCTAPPAPTTTAAPTTTTAAPTTTTVEPTTTTVAPTTTTADGPTTTAAAPTTTTVEPTTTTVEPTTTTTEAPTTTTDEPTTTTQLTGTTVASETSEDPTTTTTAESTTSTEGPTTSTVPTGTVIPNADTTSTASDSTAAPTTTTGGSGTSAGASVVTSTSVVPADREAAAELPFTGAPSAPIAILGVVLLLTGLTLTSVTRFQARRSGR
jgi:hypothetical protein